jgi:hypothetical protein
MLVMAGLPTLGPVWSCCTSPDRVCEMAPSLSIRYLEPTFALLVTGLLGVGVMATVGGVVNLPVPEMRLA